MVPYLYVDAYVVVNLLMNYVCLWATGRLVRARTTPFRLFMAAGAGALYSLAFLFPGARFLFSPAAKALFALVMVAIAFHPAKWARLLGIGGAFFGVTFVLAGSVMAMVFFTGGTRFCLQWWMLPMGAAMALCVGYTTQWYLQRGAKSACFRVQAEVFLGDSQGCLRGYLDTGNCLRDPFTGVPVLIAEYRAIRKVLPQDVVEAMKQDPLDAMTGLSGTSLAERVRLIPYTSLGNSGGMLLGFRPDALVIHRSGHTFVTRDVVIAMVMGDLGAGGFYDCLVHPELVAEGE